MHEEIDCTIAMDRANLLSLALFIPIVGVFAGSFVAFWGWPALKHGLAAFYTTRLFLPSLLVGIVVHEALHGVVWALAARRPLRSISYGVQWKTLTPYAHADEPMPVGPYRAGGIAPFVGTAVFPAAYALLAADGTVAAATLFFATVCGGDLMVLWLLRKARPGDLVKDHPERAGGIVLRPIATAARD